MDDKPLELSVSFGREKSVIVAIDGATTARELQQEVVKLLNISNAFGLHVFVTSQDRVTSLGCGSDHILDAFSQLHQMARDAGSEDDVTCKLFLRKEIFEPWQTFDGDVTCANLIYEQVLVGALRGDYEFIHVRLFRITSLAIL